MKWLWDGFILILTWGAFFSGTDRMNQQANFSSQFHIGIVIDHIRDEYAVFYGKDSIQIDNNNVIVIEE